MKKIIIGLFVVMVVILASSSEEQSILIPGDAIRFRIIASSNTPEDQELKLQIKEDLEPIISDILESSASREDTINLINDNMSLISNTVAKYNVNYDINYGLNYFPEKVYKGITYKEGNYESLVITLGEGLGDNWWCVLFPPLCLLEAREEDYTDVNYTFYIKDIIDKYY